MKFDNAVYLLHSFQKNQNMVSPRQNKI
ncbi:MAG: hypothetical protein QNJ51_15195 [Calothrix sp. MO_167.B12]|nr:hypothetical protein [Calothrix sp. MO_167.B12]